MHLDVAIGVRARAVARRDVDAASVYESGVDMLAWAMHGCFCAQEAPILEVPCVDV